MRIGCILAGLLFFVNPNILVVDILPDFIGAILLLYGLSHAGEIDERMARTRKTLYLLMYAGIGRFLCTFLIPIIDAKEYTWFLVFAFCFGLIEAYLFCRAMFSLDSGLTFLSLQSDQNEIYRSTGAGFLGMTVIFTVVKTAFAILPTLTYLVTDYGTVTEMRTNWTFVMWMLMAINVLLVTVYGILWYVRMLKFWKPLKKSSFVALIEQRYRDEYLANRPLVVYRDLKRVVLLMGVALIFAVPLRLDGMDVLHDAVTGVAIFYAARILGKLYPDASGYTVLWSALYAVISTFEWGYMVWFRMENYSHLYEEGFSEVMGFKVFDEVSLLTTFAVYCVMLAVKLLLLLLVILSMRRVMLRMIAEHTGSITEIHVSSEKTKAIRRDLRRWLLSATLLCVAAVMMSVATGFLFLWIPILQTWDMVIWTVFGIVMYYFLNRLVAGMDDRYYHED
ncbi:MAG: hypothetical protein E7599_05080 [Ruminococcaceae bacterium]|nr:hypothetical protein [Oscillospiraceae bacterium]